MTAPRPLYGSGADAITGDVMARAIARARRIPDRDVDRLVAVAGAHERPKLARVADLEHARPAVTYYACRLLAAHGQLGLFG